MTRSHASGVDVSGSGRDSAGLGEAARGSCAGSLPAATGAGPEFGDSCEAGAGSIDQASAVAPTACIELDRFCEECSYNLRTLAVTPDPRTGIPIVRCTECGRFQPANTTQTALRPWVARVTSVTLFGWMFLLIAIFFWLGMAQGAINYATLEELTFSSTRGIERNTRRAAAIGLPPPQTYQTEYGQMQVRVYTEDYKYYVPAMMSGAFAIALVSGILIVVAIPHWARFAYFLPVFGLAIASGTIVAIAWYYEANPLMDWATPYMLGHLGVKLLGGTVGIFYGRPMMRLMVRAMLPPSVRPRLAYLWLADGKTL
ncbi:MAG: hypothetical protein IH989_07420 [Planctomycetes bacterium]|nr:hypothetical protein [Planctomycetota bacterium]